jgi:hypothetical protein
MLLAFMENMRFSRVLLLAHYNLLSSFAKLRYRVRGMRPVFWGITMALASIAPFAQGYVLEGPRWPAGSILVVQLSLGDAGRTLQDGNTNWNAAVLPVLDMWNQQLGRAQVTGVMNSPAAVARGDGVNSVAFSTTVFGQAFGSSTLAVTVYSYTGSSAMTESDTLFNRAQTFDSYRGPLQFANHGPAIADVRRVFLHELGHGLGLGHPDTAGQRVTAVMNSIVSDQEVLSSDDIAGGQSLYGPPIAPPPTPTPPPGTASHLANISTRVKVGLDDNVLIGGFMVQGSQSKRLILRAIGPSLAASGIGNPLADPVLDLHDSTGAIVASNDDWSTGSQVAEIQATGLAPTSSIESALIATLPAGTYTAVVRSFSTTPGIALVEAYELDSNATRLVNISTRGRVGLTSEAMIGGLIVQGGTAKRVIVRGLGPSLSGGGVSGTLNDPVLELHDSSGTLIGSNDNWGSGSQVSEIIATTVAPPNAKESALIATLNPGNYTAVVSGVNGATGVAMVEVFDLDP